MEHVYIFTLPEFASQNKYKIGRTNNLKRRLSSLSCGGNGGYFHATFACQDSKTLEKKLHNIFKEMGHHVEKEFFIFKDIKCVEQIIRDNNELLKKPQIARERSTLHLGSELLKLVLK